MSGELEIPNSMQNHLKFRIGREAHGSICIQEGQPLVFSHLFALSSGRQSEPGCSPVCIFRSRFDLAEQILGERGIAVKVVGVEDFPNGPKAVPGRAHDKSARDEGAAQVVERDPSDAEPLARLWGPLVGQLQPSGRFLLSRVCSAGKIGVTDAQTHNCSHRDGGIARRGGICV